ncbi:MAG: putative protein D14 [Prokaryotic dsDNA virus sp.]|nr:MAG: putative protein D14 [Prokaryotic dsDNA virus sp.]|tara:strand:- start:4246 stop:4692 length:447 start_codon:yes stop_codon:yes gene_type:complete
MVHVVNKGKAGEREVVKLLQPIVNEVYESLRMQPPDLLRNQMQTAVGGYDICGLPWIALEVKRQEQLSLNAWWKQVTTACCNGEVPIVIFRQNRKKWRILMPAWLHTGGKGHQQCRAEVDLDTFLTWFRERCKYEAIKESESTCLGDM